jgi:hypothetical protein
MRGDALHIGPISARKLLERAKDLLVEASRANQQVASRKEKSANVDVACYCLGRHDPKPIGDLSRCSNIPLQCAARSFDI